jgi:hypothetical protein
MLETQTGASMSSGSINVSDTKRNTQRSTRAFSSA